MIKKPHTENCSKTILMVFMVSTAGIVMYTLQLWQQACALSPTIPCSPPESRIKPDLRTFPPSSSYSGQYQQYLVIKAKTDSQQVKQRRWTHNT